MTENGANGQAELLDVLVAGGGPGGTAVAFRARELGLSAQVIEYDDLMKRIRDYSKEKLILPSFGGGDQMRFPKGGELISALRFAPVDKDEICQTWKGLYEEHAVETRIGCELTGLEEAEDGTYEVLAWDHGERCEANFRARAVVLALGRGVPRRFDIPGNTDGICYKLEESSSLVGAPACVIGGGTSAAEAVIAISRAKAAAGDPTAVYWSYRGDRMPRVSKALAEVFFEAYVGNGNILYFPRSEPAAIVTTDERSECLSIRVDRRHIDGRPNECTYLEFAKENVIACIGEDLPEALLGSLGIHMVTGGPRSKRRMVVNRHLETRRRNVFLVGDLLSQAYFETDDFDGDPARFREVKHRGNIKSALRDGVLVAEAIRQRLAGRTQIEVEIEDAEELEPAEGAAVPAPLAVSVDGAVDRDGPPAESLGPEREVSDVEAYLIRVLPGGVEEGEHPVRKEGVTTIGRQESDLSFPHDTMLSDPHASISHGEEGYFVRDDGSATGVFLRVPVARKRELVDGDLLRAGRQFLVVSGRNGEFSFTHYDDKGIEVGRYPLGERMLVLGRRAPDVTLDPSDKTLSRRQLALGVEGGRLYVKDLKSVNGTFLRVRSATRLEHADELRVGLQRLVFSLRPDAVLDTGRFAEQPLPTTPADAAATPEPAEITEAATVTFEGTGRTLTLEPGQTLCEAAEAHGIDITAECHSGICGSDPIRILSGAEHLDAAPGDQERETLEEICELEPGPCRLACMVRARGPVKVEIVR